MMANSIKSHFPGILSVIKCSRAERKEIGNVESKDNIFDVKVEGIKSLNEETVKQECQVINSASKKKHLICQT